MFIIKGSLEDRIEYLGKFQYVILEDVLTGDLIKWDYSKKENSDIVIFSPSIIHRLNSLRNKKTVIEVDTTLITGVCKDVSYSIDVKKGQDGSLNSILRLRPEMELSIRQTGFLNTLSLKRSS